MRLYVGNLSFATTESDLRMHFSKFGVVISAKLVTNPKTGRPQGDAFVVFEDDTDGRKAINGTNGLPLDGRPLNVREAPLKEPRDGRFGSSGGYWKR